MNWNHVEHIKEKWMTCQHETVYLKCTNGCELIKCESQPDASRCHTQTTKWIAIIDADSMKMPCSLFEQIRRTRSIFREDKLNMCIIISCCVFKSDWLKNQERRAWTSARRSTCDVRPLKWKAKSVTIIDETKFFNSRGKKTLLLIQHGH